MVLIGIQILLFVLNELIRDSKSDSHVATKAIKDTFWLFKKHLGLNLGSSLSDARMRQGGVMALNSATNALISPNGQVIFHPNGQCPRRKCTEHLGHSPK